MISRKSFFLEENSKILVISKFQPQLFKFNLKLQKSPFHVVLGTWQIKKVEWVQMQDISSKNYGNFTCRKVKLEEIEYLYLVT